MALFRVSNERAQFDAAGNDASDQYGAGIRFTQGGNARVTTGSATNYNQGIPMSATGQVAIVDATAGLPAGTIFHNGLPISGDKVCVSRNATAVVSNGLPYDSAGAVAADINLDLNFIGTDTLNSSVTFTRASSATFVGSNGLIQSATTNTPRFDYDPVTLAAKGLLIEEQRTNLLTYSEDFTNAAWIKVASSVSVTANTTTAPDGNTTADTITATAGLAFHYVNSNTNPSLTGTYTYAFYVKRNNNDWIFFTVNDNFINYFNVATGQFGTTPDTCTATNVGNGWYRITATRTLAAVPGHCGVGVAGSNGGASFTALGTEAVFIWGAQLEAGSFATSYIPTVASQVTRSADVASVNTLSPWYNATEGTLYAEVTSTSDPAGTYRTQASITDVGNTNYARFRLANLTATTVSTNSQIASGGVLQADLNTSSITIPPVLKTALGFAANNFAASTNGATPLTDSTGSMPISPTSLELRGGPFQMGQTYVRRITYYPRRLSNAELQAITA